MKKYLLPATGKFYKAAMHVHTNISDGGMSVEDMQKAYVERGYSIVAFTDHEVFVTHNDLSNEDFLAINAVEVAINDESKQAGGWPYLPTYHLNLYARRADIDYSSVCTEASIYVEHSHQYMTPRMKQNVFEKEYTTESINKLIATAVEDGFLVCYNHPLGSLQNYENYIGLKGLWAAEWFNSGSNNAGMIETIQPIEDLLHKSERVCPIAGDDSHGLNLVGYCFTMVKAESLDYNTVMDAFARGDFYSSTGPEIYDLYMEGNVVHISCSEAEKVFLTTERRVTFVKEAGQDSVTEAEFDLSDYIDKSHLTDKTYQDAYFRLTVFDKYGKQAYTKAYFLTEVIDNQLK